MRAMAFMRGLEITVKHLEARVRAMAFVRGLEIICEASGGTCEGCEHILGPQTFSCLLPWATCM